MGGRFPAGRWVAASVVGVLLVAGLVSMGGRPGEEVVFADRVDTNGVTSTRAVRPDRVAWRAQGQARSDWWWGIDAQPLGVVEGVLVVQVLDHLRGIELRTGSTRYELQLGGVFSAHLHDGLLVTAEATHLVAYDATDGRVRTRHELPGLAIGVSEVSDGVALIELAGSGLAAVDLSSGDTTWRSPAGSLQFATERGFLVVHDDQVVELDAHTGRQRGDSVPWSQSSGILAVRDDIVVTMDHAEPAWALRVHDRARGHTWQVPEPSSTRRASFSSNVVALGTTDDRITLHLASAPAAWVTIDRVDGRATWHEAEDGGHRTFDAYAPDGERGTLLWVGGDGLDIVDPSTLERRRLSADVPTNATALPGHVVLSHHEPGPEPVSEFEWTVVQTSTGDRHEVAMTDLPHQPPGWTGLAHYVLLRADEHLLHVGPHGTEVRSAVDGSQVRTLPRPVIATTRLGDVTFLEWSIRLFDDEGDERWAIQLDREDNAPPPVARVLRDHLVVVVPARYGPGQHWFDEDAEPLEPPRLDVYSLADGTATGSLVLEHGAGFVDPRIEDGAVWLLDETLARLDVDDSGTPTVTWRAPAVDRLGWGIRPVVDGDDVVLVTPWWVEHWDAATGERGVEVPLPVPVPGGRGEVVHDGHLYAVSGNTLVAIDHRSGELRWQIDLRGRPSSSVALAGDRVYVGLGDGRLVSVDTSGEDRHTVTVAEGEPITGRPVVARGQILVTVGHNGDLAAIVEQPR